MERGSGSLGSAVFLCLFAFFFSCSFTTSDAAPCYPWTGGTIVINTTSSQMELVGPQELRFYPRHPITGEVDRSVLITHYNRKFIELDVYPFTSCVDVSPDLLPIPSDVIRRLRTLDWSDFNCEHKTITESLTDTVSTTALVFNLTLLSTSGIVAPDLHIEFNFTVTKGGNHDVNYGSSDLSFGQDYIAHFRDGEIKFAFRIENWPWVGVNNRSYLGVYFDGYVNSSDPYEYTLVNSNEEEFVRIETDKWRLAQSIDHMFLIDKVPSLKRFDDNFLSRSNWKSVGANTSAYAGGFSSCRGGGTGGPMPHWTTIEYDPQFSALFLPSETPETELAQTPTQKKNSNSVKIALGVTFGVVGVIVAAVIIAMLVSPSFRTFIRPYSAKRVNQQQIGNFHADSNPPQSTSSPSKQTSEGQWVRASKVPDA